MTLQYNVLWLHQSEQRHNMGLLLKGGATELEHLNHISTTCGAGCGARREDHCAADQEGSHQQQVCASALRVCLQEQGSAASAGCCVCLPALTFGCASHEGQHRLFTLHVICDVIMASLCELLATARGGCKLARAIILGLPSNRLGLIASDLMACASSICA